MENFKGTKGKWKVSGNYVTTDEQDICEVKIYGGGIETYSDIRNAEQEIIFKANVKLIATAKELLEALNESIGLLKQTTEYKRMVKFRFKLSELENVSKKATEIN